MEDRYLDFCPTCEGALTVMDNRMGVCSQCGEPLDGYEQGEVGMDIPDLPGNELPYYELDDLPIEGVDVDVLRRDFEKHTRAIQLILDEMTKRLESK